MPDDPGAAPAQAQRQRCLAALLADPRPCEGEPDEIRVVDQTGQGTTACLLHGTVLLASLDGGRVRALRGERSAAEVRRRAGLMRPFDGVWTGPGVQRVNPLEEAAVFPRHLTHSRRSRVCAAQGLVTPPGHDRLQASVTRPATSPVVPPTTSGTWRGGRAARRSRRDELRHQPHRRAGQRVLGRLRVRGDRRRGRAGGRPGGDRRGQGRPVAAAGPVGGRA